MTTAAAEKKKKKKKKTEETEGRAAAHKNPAAARVCWAGYELPFFALNSLSLLSNPKFSPKKSHFFAQFSFLLFSKPKFLPKISQSRPLIPSLPNIFILIFNYPSSSSSLSPSHSNSIPIFIFYIKRDFTLQGAQKWKFLVLHQHQGNQFVPSFMICGSIGIMDNGGF